MNHMPVSERVMSAGVLSRRRFLGQTALVAAAMGAPSICLGRTARRSPCVRVGLVTDVHFTDADRRNHCSNCYRWVLPKFADAVAHFRADRHDFVVELGDLIDGGAAKEIELANLSRISGYFSGVRAERHYVLGNHCLMSLSKREFLDATGAHDTHYSFDRGGYHFVILDANFTADGTPYADNNFVFSDANLPDRQLQWLREDLAHTSFPAVIFLHQRLDALPINPFGVNRASHVRRLLEESGKVFAVFQGRHSLCHLGSLGDGFDFGQQRLRHP
jgi:alkaline phosphatase